MSGKSTPIRPAEPERLLRRPAVQDLTGLGRARIYQMMKAGEFPRPVRLSTRAVGWRMSDLQAWIASLSPAKTEMPAEKKPEIADYLENALFSLCDDTQAMFDISQFKSVCAVAVAAAGILRAFCGPAAVEYITASMEVPTDDVDRARKLDEVRDQVLPKMALCASEWLDLDQTREGQ
jgi:prophage regulatory protein